MKCDKCGTEHEGSEAEMWWQCRDELKSQLASMTKRAEGSGADSRVCDRKEVGRAMSFWTEHAKKIHPEGFRAQEQYLGCQSLELFPALTSYVKALPGNWLDRLHEDGSFGCITAREQGYLVSRDLLDSAIELQFIESHIGIPSRVLDIGAGYGRLAYHMTTAWPDVHVDCTDTVDISQHVCAKYLEHHHVTRADVRPHTWLASPYDLAVNIHSFPECTITEIRWWLDWLRDLKVPKLLVIPHSLEMICNTGCSFLPECLRVYPKHTTYRLGPDIYNGRDEYPFRSYHLFEFT